MRKFLSTVMIIIGLVLISMPYLRNALIKQKVDKSVELVEEISYEEIQENESKKAIYDYSSIRDVGISSIIINSGDLDNKSIIGHIVIDDLNNNVPILKGVTDANLLVGAATMVEG